MNSAWAWVFFIAAITVVVLLFAVTGAVVGSLIERKVGSFSQVVKDSLIRLLEAMGVSLVSGAVVACLIQPKSVYMPGVSISVVAGAVLFALAVAEQQRRQK